MTNAHGAQVWKVRLACAGVATALAFGLWANMPYLAVEHRRLEPWKIVGLLTADLVGLLWFVRFALAHAVLGDPLVAVPLSDGRRRLRVLALAGVAAMLVDLAFTLYLMRDERDGYARGKVADAQIIAMHEHRRPAATGYELDCRFKDEIGVPREAHLRVLAKQHVLPARLPPDAARALRARGKGRNLIRIRYDPQFPARAWIDGLGWEDENGLYWFSLGVLSLQVVGTTVFLLLLSPHSAEGAWPWWWDVYRVLPLATETLCMLMMGLIDRLMDWLA